MLEETVSRFEERLGRYQATIALEPVDRMPISGINWFADTYGGRTVQEFLYDEGDTWIETARQFLRDFPEIDTLSPSRIWAPYYDVVGARTYKLSGRDLPPNVSWQFVEEEYMKADEYDLFINNQMEFMFDRYFPRVFGEFAERGSSRSYIAFLKAGMATMMRSQIMKKRSNFLEKEAGLPPTVSGRMNAPFDFIADYFRGLRGIMLDIYRQPEKVLEACDAITPVIVNAALSGADPLRRYPIQMSFHKCIFLSPKQFDTFFWPSLKKGMMMLIEAGYKIRALMEGDWSPYWHHMLELPKGTVLCDLDDQSDIFRAKKEIGHHQCLAGGIPSSMLILGTPEDVRQRVKLLCETVGKDGGYIVNSGCGIPRDTKPENFRAMIDAILEYGRYDDGIKPRPKVMENPPDNKGVVKQNMFTPWEVKLAELGGSIQGDEQLIRGPWEKFETLAYNWCLLWG